MKSIKDSFERDITYMRISVTDLCNLRCTYCMPEGGVVKGCHEQMISFEEIEKLVKAATGLGISKFRITGGEPLVKKGLVSLVSKLSQIEGVKELVMTTNGILLARYAKDLKEAGLNRVNISIDSVYEDKYRKITRGGCVYDALDGIHAAKVHGLLPKLNIVLMKGFNDDEILNFAQFTVNDPIDVRFIELMPVGENIDCEYEFMPAEEAIAKFSELKPEENEDEVARYYKIPGAKGRIGFISPISRHFCERCNKIRLTPDGKIKTCLHSETEIDIHEVLKNGNSEQVKETLIHAIKQKEKRHHLQESTDPIRRNMNRIGG